MELNKEEKTVVMVMTVWVIVLLLSISYFLM
jgi:hypothetical protein